LRRAADIHEASALSRYTAKGRQAVENQVSFEDIKELFRETDRRMERGLDVHRALHDVGGNKNGVTLQVDILVANDKGEDAVLLNAEGFEPRAW
jgi:hypothetical protein